MNYEDTDILLETDTNDKAGKLCTDILLETDTKDKAGKLCPAAVNLHPKLKQRGSDRSRSAVLDRQESDRGTSQQTGLQF